MTLEQLAEQTHFSKSALGSYEADEYKDISHYALIKLSKFYGVTADYLLNAIHVQEGEYFSRRVHDDIDGIMEDIKEAHKGRAESAPEKSVAAELKKDLDEVANFKGSRLEQWLLIYCKQNRIPYHRLTEEEKQWLIRIGSKSEFMKSHIPRRGKKN